MLKSFSAQTNALGALNYKGTWDATANTPALASSVGTKGDYYVVSTAGSTTLNGISNWGIGDWAVFNGSVWQRVEGGADLNGVNLTVSGTSTLSGKVTAQTLTIGLGGQTTVATNTALGFEALNSASLTGANNVGVGYQALLNNTSGAGNSALGDSALSSSTTASNNSAVGNAALRYFNTSNNTAVGFEAARGSTTVANNTGDGLTAVGYAALQGNTSGAQNTSVGYLSLLSNTTGSDNSAVGYNALRRNTTGGNNVAMGRDALAFNTTAGNNTALGAFALNTNTTGDGNTAVGTNALFTNSTGANNTAVGVSSLQNSTGGGNSALGTNAGDVITTGARNTIIGDSSDPSAAAGVDQTVVGQGLTGKGDDTAFIGGTNGAYNEKNVTTWETTSDQRIKKNIVSNNVGLEVISQIDVRNFEYRTAEEITDLPASAAINQSGVQLGVIAQELQEVLPECVTENSTGVLSVNTDQLIWYLVNSVKQLSAKVAELEGA